MTVSDASPVDRTIGGVSRFLPVCSTRGTAHYGPYYRIAYRIAGRQCSIYLGGCKKLAARARTLLTRLQQTRDHRRQRRRAERHRRATLRHVIRKWQQTIRASGLHRRGCEIRGRRARGIPRTAKPTPLTAR